MPNIANVSSTNTWGYLINRLNDTIAFVNSLPLNINGSIFNGNLTVNGYIHTTNLYVSTIGGSNTMYANGALGAPSVLTISTDVQFQGNVSFPNVIALPQVNTGKIVLNKTAANTENSVGGYYNSKSRFNLVLGNADVETGNNVGSNFYLAAYDDNGAYLSTPFFINRKTGFIGVNNSGPTHTLDVVGTGSFTGNLTTQGYLSGNTLVLQGGTSADVYLQRNTATAGNNSIFSLANNVVVGQLSISTPSQDSFLSANVGGVSHYAWYYQGNTNSLGINTSTPAHTLDVVGDAGVSGNLNVTMVLNVANNIFGRDIYAYRANTSPGTGVIFLGNTGSRFLYYDGANYNLPGATTFSASFAATANSPFLILNKVGASTEAYITAEANGITRSIFSLAASATETGGNNGSDIYLKVFSDTGAFLSTPFFIQRSTGYMGVNNITPSYNLDVNGSMRANGSIVVSNNISSVSGSFSGNVSANAVITYSIGGDAISHIRNKIVNGDFSIDQKHNGGVVSLTQNTNAFALDRWFFQCQTDGTAAYNIQSIANTTTVSGATNYCHISVVTADVVGSVCQHYLQQQCEGYDVADLQFGTAQAKPIVVSFLARSSLTGTFGGKVVSPDGTRVCGFTYTITSANTWTYCSASISGDITGTYPIGNAKSLGLVFDLGTNSTNSLTAGTWTAVSAYNSVVAGATAKLIQNAAATLDITNVQLEKGSAATLFEPMNYSQALRKCQRFYQPIVLWCFQGYNTAGANTGGQLYYPVPMFATPTVTLANPIYLNSQAPITVTADTNAYQVYLLCNTNTTGFARTFVDVLLSAEI